MDAIHPRDLGTILSIWAHPDDETYLAGGVMATAAAHGQRVVCVSATSGEHGTDDPSVWPPDRLGEVRRWEAAAAMAILGVDEHRFLGLPDGALAGLDASGPALVGELIDDVDPDTILTFGSDGRTFHPDHVAVHRWVTEAWKARGGRVRLLYAAVTSHARDRFGDLEEDLGYYMSDERPVGVAVENLSLHLHMRGSLLDRKLAALRAMATQTSGLIAAVPAATYAALVAEEAFVAARQLEVATVGSPAMVA